MNLITNLLTIQNQMRVFHWQTQKKPGSFAQHDAFGKAYEALDPLIDDFIEIFQGKNGAIMGRDGFVLKHENLSSNPKDTIEDYITFLRETVGQSLEPDFDSDLLNIRDEMMAVLNQTKYRLNMM